jgi:hypothetical protein
LSEEVGGVELLLKRDRRRIGRHSELAPGSLGKQSTTDPLLLTPRGSNLTIM